MEDQLHSEKNVKDYEYFFKEKLLHIAKLSCTPTDIALVDRMDHLFIQE